ncbi:MAG: hypothetical protein JXB47_02520 [Anaerolineae bacterium]|nr:hypothetical protein [Anaerolineae bacterium]
MPRHPLAEVFGFPTDNFSIEAKRYRRNRLCPYNNKVPSCTKDKAKDPLGVCSIHDGEDIAITCPIRFREGWFIVEDAGEFFFPTQTQWTALTEVRLNDKYGQSAGNIDLVLVSYDEQGHITDFGSLEVQAVYISGSVRRPFEFYMDDPVSHAQMDWTDQINYPRPDYLSSSRKRLAPQLLYKGGILRAWGKRQAVAMHRAFYQTLPALPQASPEEADLAWFIYDLRLDAVRNCYRLVQSEIVYTRFEPALHRITVPEPGPIEDFVERLQDKLDKELEDNAHPPDAPTLTDILSL